MYNNNNEDADLVLALELSRKQAEEDAKRREAFSDDKMKDDGAKIHDLQVQADAIGEHLQKGFK